MPSPFPGMDPYLEGPLWTTLHHQLSSEIIRQLAPRVQPRYLVLPVERFVIDIPDEITVTTASIYPDRSVVQAHPIRAGDSPVSTIDPPLRLPTVIPIRVPHITVEIRDTAQRQLVTAIEILSPTNKREPGREEYLRKRRRILMSTAHLLEIDLLHRGFRVPLMGSLPDAPYFIFLGRAERRPMTDIWPVRLVESLPSVPVPLLPGDSDVWLDLQAAFTNVYDLLRYDLAINYQQAPEVSLREEELTWIDERLRARET